MNRIFYVIVLMPFLYFINNLKVIDYETDNMIASEVLEFHNVNQKKIESNKLSVIVLPPYDEIANEGISPDIQKLIENELLKDTSLSVLKFPFRKLINIPYQNVFDKKYCKQILEKVNSKIIVMSKLEQVNKTGSFYNDTWNLKIKIYNSLTDCQINSKVKADSLTSKEIRKVLLIRHSELIKEIKSTNKVTI